VICKRLIRSTNLHDSTSDRRTLNILHHSLPRHRFGRMIHRDRNRYCMMVLLNSIRWTARTLRAASVLPEVKI